VTFVAPKLVFERACYDEDLLTRDERDALDCRTGRDARHPHSLRVFSRLEQNEALYTDDFRGTEVPRRRVNDERRTTHAGKLAQLDEQGAAPFRERGMAIAVRVEQVRARANVAAFVGERACQHEDFLAVRVVVRRQCDARVVANESSDSAPG